MLDDSTGNQVRGIVVAMADKWQWQLATVDELVAFVLRSLPLGQPLDADATRYILCGEYNRILYQAALGTGDAPDDKRRGSVLHRRQERAFVEVGIYIFACALARRYPADEVERAVPAALTEIHLKMHLCRDPAAFRAWCWSKLRTLLQGTCGVSKEISLEDLLPHSLCLHGDDEEAYELRDWRALDPEHYAVSAILWKQFLDRIAALSEREATGAVRQIAAVLLKYLAGMSDAEIAEELGTTHKNVYVLRAHGKARLKRDPELMQICAALLDSGYMTATALHGRFSIKSGRVGAHQE